MNSDMSITKNKTKDPLLPTTKSCETPIEETHTRRQEILEFKLTQPSENFPIELTPNLGLYSKWMIGLKGLEVYNFF